MIAMKFSFLLLLSVLAGLVACTSVDRYVKTRQSQYLSSQDFGPLKGTQGFEEDQTSYIIPTLRSAKPTHLPDLRPPTI